MKEQNHQEKWDFYLLNVDDNIASIYVDLGLQAVAPILGKENIFLVSIQMNNPREDGLSSNEESKKLWEIEDLIVKEISSNHDVVYAGRLTNDNRRDLYFYFGIDQLIDSTLSKCMVQYPSYKYEFGIKENDNWEHYFSFLYPAPRDFQRMKNVKVLEYMEERGDKLLAARIVDHWIYFKTEFDRQEFEKEVIKMGFKITDTGVDDQFEFKYKLVISREDKVGRGDIDDYTVDLFELANKHNGNYDGWETPLIVE